VRWTYDEQVLRQVLSNDLRDPDLNIASFGRRLKTHLFQLYPVFSARSALEALCDADTEFDIDIGFSSQFSPTLRCRVLFCAVNFKKRLPRLQKS